MSVSRARLFALALPLLLAACTPTNVVPAASPSAPPTATATVSATSAAPTASSSPTPTPREDPPAVATDPVAIGAQIVLAERSVRDPSTTGADLAWMGHLQQRIYRAIAARPEWRAPP